MCRMPEPGPGQVRLQVLATGVCGTDVHLHAGEFGPTYPLTPGHEIVGVVDEHRRRTWSDVGSAKSSPWTT